MTRCLTVVEPAGDTGDYTYRCLCTYESRPMPEEQARRFALLHETGRMIERKTA